MRLPIALACLAAVAGPGAAEAALCDRLTVPDGYTLLCQTEVEAGERSERLVVRPSGGVSTALAQLTVTPLEPELAPLAWSAPERWLREQVAVDVTGLSTALTGWSSGPMAHPVAKATLDGLVTMLAGWSRLPLEGCVPDERAGRDELQCSWGVEPLTIAMNLRLVASGDDRFAVSYWAVDDQRLRHLEAIANSFAPG